MPGNKTIKKAKESGINVITVMIIYIHLKR